MLINVNVRNLALIKEADVYFDEGLNILTGETGAGKSIIIGSILIALGGKLSKDMVRDDKKEALVELVFSLQNRNIVDKLHNMGVSIEEDGQLIISRKILNGRSTIKVNGETFNVSALKNVTELLIDIHGQHDHQSLLKKDKQLVILDDFAEEDIKDLKNELKNEYQVYQSLKDELKEYDIDDDARNREISFCQFEIDEIDNAHLKYGEYEEVEEAYKKMSSAKDIIFKMNEVYELLGGGGFDGTSDRISNALKTAQSASELDKDIDGITESLMDLESICQDTVRAVKEYVDNMSFDEEEIIAVEQRLDELNRLRQKYEQKKVHNDIVKNILEYRNLQEEKLNKLIDLENRKNLILDKIKVSEEKLDQLSEKLTERRKKNASVLADNIENVLKGLNFLDARFNIEFNKCEHFRENGRDDIEFVIATNPGEDLKPLSKVASGGELSRIMLGIKTIMAKRDDIETLIFDEIDTGISGRTAQMVAERMKEISKIHQIICITHLPQIAAMADNHYLIEKEVKDNITETNIYLLDDEESVNELARMLGGVEITKTVLDNAREMKSLVNN